MAAVEVMTQVAFQRGGFRRCDVDDGKKYVAGVIREDLRSLSTLSLGRAKKNSNKAEKRKKRHSKEKMRYTTRRGNSNGDWGRGIAGGV